MRLLSLLGAAALLFVTFTSSGALAKGDTVLIKFETSMGDFVVELDKEKAPHAEPSDEQEMVRWALETDLDAPCKGPGSIKRRGVKTSAPPEEGGGAAVPCIVARQLVTGTSP